MKYVNLSDNGCKIYRLSVWLSIIFVLLTCIRYACRELRSRLHEIVQAIIINQANGYKLYYHLNVKLQSS